MTESASSFLTPLVVFDKKELIKDNCSYFAVRTLGGGIPYKSDGAVILKGTSKVTRCLR